MTKSEKMMNLEMIELFRSYRANKKKLNKMAAEKATENMSVDYSKPSVVSGGGNGQENKIVSIIAQKEIIRKKVEVVERTVAHFIGNQQKQDVIKNLLMKNVNVKRYAYLHAMDPVTAYRMRNDVLVVAKQWASYLHIMRQDGGDEGDFFCIELKK